MEIPALNAPLPQLTTAQMKEVDRLMVEHYQINLLQMMENAGRCLALLAKHLLGDSLAGKRIVVLAGTGGNGGGAMAGARRLANWGAEVSVWLSNSQRLAPVPAHQAEILKRMGIPLAAASALGSRHGGMDLVLDGIIGYSLTGPPRGSAKSMIEWAHAQAAPVLALDVPSGIELTHGQVFEPAIRAVATLTLALPKKGLFAPEVKPLRGALYLGDISVPPALYAQPGLELEVGPLFARGDLLRLD
ncbi:MAG: NAD(P)H-hydrate epimerase [Bacteroidetes bacterium]|nr:MAG: NAD(P)H-hydrate epimerase [Bacteroidota bacterium]